MSAKNTDRDITNKSAENTNKEITNNLRDEEVGEGKTFVCTLSREEIRENRRIKRKQKRHAAWLEKQKQREDKLYQEMATRGRTEKLKIIKEEELSSHRSIQAADRCNVNGNHEKQRDPFEISDNSFPKLKTSDILEATSSVALNVSYMETTQLSNIVKNVTNFMTDKKNFPGLSENQTKGSEASEDCNLECYKVIQSKKESLNVLSKDCTEDNALLNNMETLSSGLTNDASNNAKIDFNQKDTKNGRKNPKKTNKLVNKEPEKRKGSKRTSYSINLLQTVKIQQRKKEKRKKSTNKIKAPLQIEGNLLDSSKPLKMNKGKLYLRKDGVRKNKKKTTRMKKIIYNYRTLKKEHGVEHDKLTNVLLSKEFLDLLICHIGSDFDLNSDCDKQILLFNFFTDKKKRNKIWDKMRDCIRDNIDKSENGLKMNLECNNVINNDAHESDCKTNIDGLNEIDSINNNLHIKGKSDHIIRGINVDEDPRIKHNDEIQNKNCDLDTSKNKSCSNECHSNRNTITFKTNILSHVEENFTKSAIIDVPNGQTQGSKKQKRLQKKMQRKLALNLDETIVMNRSKADREAVGIVENKMNLMNIVDAVAKKDDIQDLCSSKLQIHSRSFRPYCNQMPSPSLRMFSIDLIKQIVQFQKRLYKADPLKGAAKRRYLVGINEARKNLPIKGKVKLLFVAPDLEYVPISGGIEDEVQNLLTMATLQSVPYLFSVPRRTLGSITFRAPSPVSCVAVLDYSGCEVLVEQILPLIEEAKRKYDIRLNEALRQLANTDVTNTDQSNVSHTDQSNVSNTDQSNVSNTDQSNVSNTNQSNVSNTDQSNVSNTDQSNVSNTDQSNVSNTDQSNASNTDQPNVSNTDQSNVSNTDQSNVSNTDQSNVSNTDQSNVSNTDQSNVSNTDQSNVSNTDQSNVSNTDQSNVSNTDQSNVSNTDQSNVSNTDQSKIVRDKYALS